MTTDAGTAQEECIHLSNELNYEVQFGPCKKSDGTTDPSNMDEYSSYELE